MPKCPDKRLRFTVEQDMQLLQEIIKENPFEDMDRWKEVHENFVNECNVPFSLRTCKDHANHLLNLHLKDSLKMRPRELPEDFDKKKKYLDEIIEMRRQFCSETSFNRGFKTGNWLDSSSDSTILRDPSNKAIESDDDFYWEEENERDKREKEREANDADGKLRRQELALEERRAALHSKRLKLDEDRLALDQLERRTREEMEKTEREIYKNVAKQNQTIITALMDRYSRRNGGNNLCIL